MDWRKIEAALVEIAEANGIDIEEVKGNKFINVESNGGLTGLCLADVAQEIAEKCK